MNASADRAVDAVPVRRRETGVDVAADGVTVKIVRDPQGRNWSGLVHDEDGSAVAAEGRFSVVVAGARAAAAPGDRARIPAGALSLSTTPWFEGRVRCWGEGAAGMGGRNG